MTAAMRFASERIVFVTVMCERCGIDSTSQMCDDCVDVMNVEVPPANYSTRVEREQAREWLEMGIPLKEVAESLGYRRATIQKWVDRYGWQRFFWADAKGISNKVKARFH